MPTKMKILIVNDDNIYSRGLHLLAEHLSTNHSVTVVAPKTEMSGVSHACTINAPLFVEPFNIGNKIKAYAINGTPSDCVKVGIRKLCESRPDLIISGFNHGENSGISSFYSGTVAGAREGALFGIRSIALSLTNYTDPFFTYALNWLDNFLKQLNSGFFDFNPETTFLSINFPQSFPSDKADTVVVKQATTPFNDDYEERKTPNGKAYYWLYGDKPLSGKQDDETLLAKGFVTITPLCLDMTDKSFLEKYSCHDNLNLSEQLIQVQ